MTEDEDAVVRLVRKLEESGVPYMIAGSMASSHHGLPRATNDADVVIDPSPEALERLLASLGADGYYADAAVARDALARRRLFNVIDPATAFKIDLIVRKDRPFSRQEFERRVRVPFGGHDAALATAEDTILSKLEWAKTAGGSERQLADVAGIVAVNGDRLDRDYVERWADALGVVDLWRSVIGRP